MASLPECLSTFWMICLAALSQTASDPTLTRAAGAASIPQLLQDAFYQEVAMNDPERALRLYDQALARPEISDGDAARAHLRKGICFHLQGKWEEAEKEFQTVADRYPGEAEARRIAERYLGSGSPHDPARFMPPETLIYLELVNPGEQAGFLSELIRGTPFENPVDYYLSVADEKGPASSRLPRPPEQTVRQLRAVLNLGFIKELQKIEGLAIGFSSIDESRADFLAVFLPGSSDLSRGLIKAILAEAIEELAGSIEGMSIFRMRRNEAAERNGAPGVPLFLALDSREETVLVGTPRETVEEAIRRQRTKTPAGSLATLVDYRRAQSARAGSLIFTYLQGEKLLPEIRARIPAGGRREFETVSTLLGIEHLRSVSLTLSRLGDAFRLALRSQFDRQSQPVWESLHTPVLESGILRFIPRRSPAFLAFSVSQLTERLRRLKEAGSRALPELLESVPGELLRLLDDPKTAAGQENGKSAGPEPSLRNLALVWAGKAATGPVPALYLVLEFQGGEMSTAAYEERLKKISAALFRNLASTQFRDGPRLAAGGLGEALLRVVEPAPGWQAGYARIGGVFLLSPFASTLEEAIERIGAGDVYRAEELPVAARKVLYLKPKDIIEQLQKPGGSALEINAAKILSKIPKAILHTQESPQGFSIELTVPEAAPILRSLLNSVMLKEGKRPN